MPSYPQLAVYQLRHESEGGFVTTASLSGRSFRVVDYSHIKYGSQRPANRYGREIADAAVLKFPTLGLAGSDIVVVSNPYFHIPHAAHMLTNGVQARLDEIRRSRGLGLSRRVEIRRRSVEVAANEKSYGRLRAEERPAWIDANPIFLSGDEDVAGAEVFVVDDLVVTGNARDQMGDFFENRGARVVRFGFLAALDLQGGARDAASEATLNQSDIEDLDDLLRLRSSSAWIMTPWATRMLLTDSNHERVLRFLGELTEEELLGLRYAIAVERYGELDLYRENCKLVESEYGSRSSSDLATTPDEPPLASLLGTLERTDIDG